MYDYSSIQTSFINNKDGLIKLFNALINPDDVFINKEDHVNGIQDEAHITIKYGLHTPNKDKILAFLVHNEIKPITITLGNTSIFENEDFDVVKLTILSEDLFNLNKLISKSFDVTDTYPDYLPHLTVAYVKKGTGVDYDGIKTKFSGKKYLLNNIEFSSKDESLTRFIYDTNTGLFKLDLI